MANDSNTRPGQSEPSPFDAQAINLLKADLIRLKVKNARYAAEVIELEDSLDRKREKVQTLTTRLNDRNSEIEELDNLWAESINPLTASVKSLERALASQAHVVNELAEAKSKNEALAKENARLSARVRALEEMQKANAERDGKILAAEMQGVKNQQDPARQDVNQQDLENLVIQGPIVIESDTDSNSEDSDAGQVIESEGKSDDGDDNVEDGNLEDLKMYTYGQWLRPREVKRVRRIISAEVELGVKRMRNDNEGKKDGERRWALNHFRGYHTSHFVKQDRS
ncbi:hypothetical protein HDU98_008460 [Podochytrium sp. JEL0797]|nr:hypothetical protein HDU98_008460 [Podochytrium sp. JEL0797]